MTRARRGRGLAPKTLVFDYKDVNSLKRFVTEGGKIVPRRISRLSAKQQRALKREIMRARQLAFLPYPGQN